MSLFHAGLQPALDDDGNPISGATWNFYRTGTLAAASVYSDASLGTSLGSTVTADAAGRFDVVFLDDAVRYRAILKDAGGTTLNDIDPINPADTAPVSVIAFGAVADGTTDDAAAIQSALDSGASRIFFPAGTYSISESLDPPSNVIIEGEGKATVILSTNAAADRFIFYTTSKSNITIRDMKLTPLGGGTGTRAAIQLNSCTDCKVENIIVEDITDNNGVFLVDCDRIVIDRLYFNGGGAGNGVYNSGGRDCKVTNSHATDCFAGFTISSAQTDSDLAPVATVRDVTDTYNNVIANCTVVNCHSQSYTVTGAIANTVSACHARDYAGASTHKAFQAKDTADPDATGDPTRGNVFIGCTVKNYPAGFGAQETSHTHFIDCTTRDNSTNAFEFNAASKCQVIGCSAYEFTLAGILLSKTSTSTFNGVKLETSTATAIGIKDPNAGASQTNNFDNITTLSTLAKFIDLASGSTGNRFGPGCRTNSNAVTDGSGATQWPCLYRTDIVDLTSLAQTKHGMYQHRGMHVAAVRFVVTTTIAGSTSPEVQAGIIGSNAAIAASTVVTGSAGATVLLTRASEIMTTASVPQVRVNVAASGGTPAGAGYLQFEGFPL